ncbi:hypothetical protein ABT167_35330 [Streptomyces sp. NPDC001792]|uniref:hypothetical protein n=1 Tax=Streptomyces sp. NPDC001792 TaxID=3154524 RepID=UPI003319E298
MHNPPPFSPRSDLSTGATTTCPAAQVRAVLRTLERPAPPPSADAAGTGTGGAERPAG